MYLVYCALLWVFVYFTPALAIFPQLISSPRIAFAIPIISTFIIYCLSSLLIQIDALNGSIVTLNVILLGILALLRVRMVVKKVPFTWTWQAGWVYLLHLALLFPYFVKLGTSAFDRGDEVYSWNFWAVQHYFLEPIDFSHTGAVYPQLFPKLLAFCYHFLGNLDLQLPVKASLIVFPWSMLTAIALSCRSLRLPAWIVYIPALAYVLAGVGLEQFFNDGYADPIMTSCLIVSAALFWQSRGPYSQFASFSSSLFSPRWLMLFSVLCAIACAHTKQAGLLWTLFSLPLLIIMWAPREQWRSFYALGLLSLLGGLWWILGEGQQFYHNEGVLYLSLGGRSLASQALYSLNKYFVHQPLLLGLFVVAFVAACRCKLLLQMYVLFVLPSLVCWFLFGAYQLRLGQHLIAFTFFIVIASGYLTHVTWLRKKQGQKILRWCWRQQHAFLVGSGVLSLSLGALLFVKEVWVDKGGISLYAGGRQSLQRYFSEDADYVYRTIFSNPQAVLWVPSRYLYGLFYKHTQLTTPDYEHYKLYDQAALIEELQRKLPDYVFTVSQDYIDGPASWLLRSVVTQCPQAFKKVSSSNNKFSFVTYKVNKLLLQQDPCLHTQIAANKAHPVNASQQHLKFNYEGY